MLDRTAADALPGDCRGDTVRRECLLASMRLAVLNLRTWQHELEFIGSSLKTGLLSLDAACEALEDNGLLHWLPSEAGTYVRDEGPPA